MVYRSLAAACRARGRQHGPAAGTINGLVGYTRMWGRRCNEFIGLLAAACRAGGRQHGPAANLHPPPHALPFACGRWVMSRPPPSFSSLLPPLPPLPQASEIFKDVGEKRRAAEVRFARAVTSALSIVGHRIHHPRIGDDVSSPYSPYSGAVFGARIRGRISRGYMGMIYSGMIYIIPI